MSREGTRGGPIPQREGVTRAGRRRVRRGLNRAARRLGARSGSRYLRTTPNPRLHVGCGGNLLAGWLNVDRDPVPGAAYLDVRRSFPLPSGSFERVFSEHVIEHLDWSDGLGMLRECHRALRPGGQIRVGTPDIARIVALFASDNDDAARRYMRAYAEAFLPAGTSGPAFVANQAFRGWGHRFLYDEQTLADGLRAAGFDDVRRLPWGESDDEAFRGVEAADDEFTRDARAYETLCLEAVRR